MRLCYHDQASYIRYCSKSPKLKTKYNLNFHYSFPAHTCPKTWDVSSFLTWKLLSNEPFRIELVTKPIVIWFNWNWLAPIHFDMRVLVLIWSWHGLGHFARGKLTACVQIRFLLIHTWLRLFCKWRVRGILHNPIWKYQHFCFHMGILMTDKQRALIPSLARAST